MGKAIYGTGSALGKEWTDKRFDELDEGRLDELIEALACHADHVKDADDCRKYIDRNRERMRYQDFRRMGLCTSSGVVEAGCRTVVTRRLKCGGMHWTVDGANAIIALRSAKLSGRLEDFFEYSAFANLA